MAETSREVSKNRLWAIVCALGAAQIISWGSFYYTIAVLGESIGRELGLSSSFLFGAFTFSLLVSGMAAPTVGRLIDQYGGRRILCAGSGVGTVALLVMAASRGPISLTLGFFLSGLAMSVCLYEAAFITLNQVSGERYRTAVTALTLWGGLASTAFWPLGHWMLEWTSWRMALLSYALMQLCICLPLHVLSLPRWARVSNEGSGRSSHAEPAPQPDRRRYLWLALAFAIGSFVLSALSVHIIGLLKEAGLSARQAVLVATLIGPMQVLVRLLEFIFARRAGPVAVGAASFALMVAATLALYFVDGYSALPFVVALLYGFSNGIMTIIRGTVPAVLFGRQGYGLLLGRLARPAFVARAMAPFAFSLTLSLGLSRGQSILLLAFSSLLAGLAYLQATGTPVTEKRIKTP